MRLKKLYIKDYKNIKDQTFDFSANTGYIALIGLNGSGKSNLLEAISLIFDDLYGIQHNEKVNGYTITYEIGGISYTYTTLDKHNNVVPLAKEDKVCPSNVIACYSGEDPRLWHMAYEKYYMQYFKDAIRDKTFSPKIIYINKYCWKIALISLLCSSKVTVKEFLKNVLSIDDIKSVNIHLEADDKKRAKFADHMACKWYDYIKHLQDEDEHRMVNANVISTTDMMTYGASNIKAPDFVFQFLFLLALPVKNTKKGQTIDKLITGISITIDGVSFDNLSEGEKKMILIECITQVLGDEHSLVLLDEPDAHVHVENKKKLLEDTIIPFDGQSIFTTHSPYVCKFIPDRNSIWFINNGIGKEVNSQFDAAKILIPEEQLFYLLFTTKNIVITEGKTDCKYIQKAISLLSPNYPILEHKTDFISVGGTDYECIKELLEHIPNIDGRKIIVIVDRDGSGLNCAKKLLGNDHLKKEDFSTARSLASLKPNSNVVMLPNSRGDQSDFIVEDYFDNAKLRELTINEICTEFVTDSTFNSFPPVKKDLKERLLPSFVDHAATASDVTGFKILLDMLTDILK